MTAPEAAILAAYYFTLSILVVYSVHRAYLVRLRRRAAQPRHSATAQSPALTVQLPLYNEPNVAARLIDAVARMEYDGALDIQVLDDSTDETSAIVAERVARWRSRGVVIAHLQRSSRDGFKAGALARGLNQSTSELFAIFDADFVPSPDTLQRLVPWFADPTIGMVQGRWDHLNRDTSVLTRVQAVYLDAHFAVESAARNFSGRFFNFNGTAGIWRRAAIEDAGGWSASTLTEDLDLSYRAQLAGWKFVFVPDVTVPAELPAALSGFQAQQHRWAKGSIQTARKLLPRVWRCDQPLRVKIEALFHLTNNVAYLLTVILTTLIVPAMAVRQRNGVRFMLFVDLPFFLISTGSVLLFYVEGQRQIGRRMRARDLACVLPVGIGIAFRNAIAVVGGLFGDSGEFIRTPKRGRANSTPLERRPRLPWIEAALAIFLAGAALSFAARHFWAALPFILFFLGGYAHIAWRAVSERLTFDYHVRRAPEPRRHAPGGESDRRSADADRSRRAASDRQTVRIDARRAEVH